MPQGTETRRIEVKVVGSNIGPLKKMADSLGLINQNTKGLASSFNSLKNALGGYVALLGIRELIAYSDEIQNLKNRLLILTGSQEAANKVLGDLQIIARRTNSSISDIAQSYTRIAASLKSSGVSTNTLLDVTETLQIAFKTMGATAEETQSVIVQLSQAFSRGALQGQELRSVMLGSVSLADLLRQRFGVDLAKAAEKGLITPAIFIDLLRKGMTGLNEDAKKLTPTIGQTLTNALGLLKLAIGKVNEEFNVAGNFAKFVDYAIAKLPVLALSLGLISLAAIPALITSMGALAIAAKGLGVALFKLALANPITAGLAIAGAAVLLFVDNLDQLKIAYYETVGTIALLTDKLSESVAGLFGQKDAYLKSKNDLKEFALDYKAAAQSYRDENAKNAKSGPFASLQQFAEDQKKLGKSFGVVDKPPKIKEILAELNKELDQSKITLGEYNTKVLEFDLGKLKKQFLEGAIAAEAYYEGRRKIDRIKINRSFEEGTISLQQFNQAISESNLKDLEAKLKSGSIAMQEFDVSAAKIANKFSAGGALRAGTQSYLDSLGTTTQQVAAAITSTFQQLEDRFLAFIKTGKFNFKEFATAILDDLTKIIIRASIIKPLAEGILQGTSPNTTATTQNATGNVYDSGGLKKFASGGIVSSATAFGYGSGKTGIMGEAGPEAILPLARGRGGDLGVQAVVTPVNINIVNQSSAEIESRETSGPNGERTIELLILNKVREGVGSGALDKVMQQSYGLRRKSN